VIALSTLSAALFPVAGQSASIGTTTLAGVNTASCDMEFVGTGLYISGPDTYTADEFVDVEMTLDQDGTYLLNQDIVHTLSGPISANTPTFDTVQLTDNDGLKMVQMVGL
jgi:hypothetical protein